MNPTIVAVLSTVPEVDAIAVSSSDRDGIAVYSFVSTVSQFVYGPLMHRENLLHETTGKRLSFHVRAHGGRRLELVVPAGAKLIWERK